MIPAPLPPLPRARTKLTKLTKLAYSPRPRTRWLAGSRTASLYGLDVSPLCNLVWPGACFPPCTCPLLSRGLHTFSPPASPMPCCGFRPRVRLPPPLALSCVRPPRSGRRLRSGGGRMPQAAWCVRARGVLWRTWRGVHAWARACRASAWPSVRPLPPTTHTPTHACPGESWLYPQMVRALSTLHRRRAAAAQRVAVHCVELWRESVLVAGQPRVRK